MPMNQELLIDGDYVLEKQENGMHWTYIALSGIGPEHRDTQGLVRVCGTIDHYSISQFNLLPMKGGSYMLTVKAAIRKSIRKNEGDTVHIVLYTDQSPVVVPDEILVCLLDAPKAHDYFMTLSPSNQKYYIDWIMDAKRMETKVERICKTIERLEKGLRFWDW